VAGAGTWYYDDLGTSRANDDFESYVVAIAGDVLTLAGNAAGSVTHAAVEQNPVKNYAAYFTKANLAEKARGIHNDKPYVSFGYSLNPANTLQVNVDASASACSGSLARCDAFVWSWGDLTPDTTTGVPTASHIYAAAGTYAITLTVQEYGVSEGSTTKNVRVFAIDAPPVAGGTACASIVNPNTWVASLVDNSTDDNGVRQVTVSWGDGGALSSAIDPTPPYSLIGTVFPHTYLNAGSYTIRQTAYDTAGQANVRTCPAVTLTTFTLSGNARRLNNTAVANATVTVKLAGVTVRTVFTNSLGNYTVANLKPGTYTITATRTGLTFPQVYNQLVGPSASGLNFQSIQ
ncbi:MAG: PKD domain-containing protein, partial [Thermoanaerobaculia bacterium]